MSTSITPVHNRNVPLLDLQAQLISIRSEVLSAIERVVDSQKFILGEEVQKLEEQIAAYTNTAFAIAKRVLSERSE